MVLDAERAGVLLVGAYRRSKTRPPSALEMQVVKNIEEWLCEREAWNRKSKCPTLLGQQRAVPCHELPRGAHGNENEIHYK